MHEFMNYQLKYVKSNMYLTIEDMSALLVDPNPSEDAMAILKDAHVQELTILLTHEHYDHISGVNWYKREFPTTIICQSQCSKEISNAENNIPLSFFALMSPDAKGHEKEVKEFCDSLPTEAIEADIVFDEAYDFQWKGHKLHLSSRPGHSPGSMVIEWDNAYLFSGDYMILDLPVFLRMPGGSKKMYRQHTLPYLLGLENHYIIMPGHGSPYHTEGLIYKNDIFTKA